MASVSAAPCRCSFSFRYKWFCYMVSKRNTTKNLRWHPGLWVLIVLTLIILYARILVTKTSMLLLARLQLDQTSGFLVKVLLSLSFSLGFWLSPCPSWVSSSPISLCLVCLLCPHLSQCLLRRSPALFVVPVLFDFASQRVADAMPVIPRNREDHHRQLRGPGASLEGQVVLAGSQTERMLLALTRFFGSLPST